MAASIAASNITLWNRAVCFLFWRDVTFLTDRTVRISEMGARPAGMTLLKTTGPTLEDSEPASGGLEVAVTGAAGRTWRATKVDICFEVLAISAN